MKWISMILNFVYLVVMSLPLYTDHGVIPGYDENGDFATQTITHQRNAWERMQSSGWLLMVEVVVMALTVISAILLFFVKDHALLVKANRYLFIASSVLFVVVMVMACVQTINY